MSSASKITKKGPKFAMMVVGGLTAMGIYIMGVRPYLEKKYMERLEAEARQIYVMSQNRRQMAEHREETPSSQAETESR